MVQSVRKVVARVVKVNHAAFVVEGDEVIVSENLDVESEVLHPELSLMMVQDAAIQILERPPHIQFKKYSLADGVVDVVFELVQA